MEEIKGLGSVIKNKDMCCPVPVHRGEEKKESDNNDLCILRYIFFCLVACVYDLSLDVYVLANNN